MKKTKYKWNGKEYQEITKNFSQTYCFDTKEEAVFDKVKNQKRGLEREIQNLINYIDDAFWNTQEEAKRLNITEDVKDILPEESIRELRDYLTKYLR